MFCKNCGTQLDEGTRFCTECGTALEEGAQGAGGETTIIVKRRSVMWGFLIPMKVWVDGREMAKGIRPGKKAEITVANGEHRICAGTSIVDRGDELIVDATGANLYFLAKPQIGVLTTRYSLTRTDESMLADVTYQKISLLTVWDSVAKCYTTLSGGSITDALERDMKNIETEMERLKTMIEGVSKDGDPVLTGDFQTWLGYYNKELVARMKALKKVNGQHYRRSVSAWSMGKKLSIFTGILCAYVLGCIGAALTSVTGLNFFMMAGGVGGFFLGFFYGHYLPVYNSGKGRFNMILSLLIGGFMGLCTFGYWQLVPRYVWNPDNWIFLLVGGPPLLCYLAVRNKVKPAIIVLALIAALGLGVSVQKDMIEPYLVSALYTERIPARSLVNETLYSEPGARKPIKTIPAGEMMYITGAAIDRYVPVISGDDRGWVFDYSLIPYEENWPMYYEFDEELKSGPTATSETIIVIRAGEIFSVTGAANNRYFPAVYNGVQGWVPDMYLNHVRD